MATRSEDNTTSHDTTGVLAIDELRGRTVYGSDGERMGVVHDVDLDEGGIGSLHVRERWMLGRTFVVPAAGLRLEEGDVHVPVTRDEIRERQRRQERAADAATGDPSTTAATATGEPVFLAGRAGARGRFGGLDLVGSLLGALVTVGSLVIVGGLLAAIFGSDPTVVDTSSDTFALVTSESMLVGGVTIFVAFLLGGIAAGRSARFDGVANGLVSVLWVLGFGVLFGALAAWIDDGYDLFVGADLPSFLTDDFAVWGSVAFAATFVLMLVGGALGGALGEAWHRRADRAMLDVVAVDPGATPVAGQVGSPAAARRDDDTQASGDVTGDRSVRRPHS